MITNSTNTNCSTGSTTKLAIGIVGFWNFGQFLAKRFVFRGNCVIGVSRRYYLENVKAIGCHVGQTTDALMDTMPTVVMFYTSITSLHSVLVKVPLHRLATALVADVLSVKLYPRDFLLKFVSPSTDIQRTHPMFGPESGR